MLVNLLIPYVPLSGHHDPILEEFTYGDIGARGRKLKKDLSKGDCFSPHDHPRQEIHNCLLCDRQGVGHRRGSKEQSTCGEVPQPTYKRILSWRAGL